MIIILKKSWTRKIKIWLKALYMITNRLVLKNKFIWIKFLTIQLLLNKTTQMLIHMKSKKVIKK